MLRKILTIPAIVCLTSTFLIAQSVSIELIDTTTSQKTGEIGYRGTAADGYLYLGTPNAPEVKVKNGNVDVTGSVSAGSYIKGGVEFDSVRAASVADIAKDVPDGVITSQKLAPRAVTDDHIDSVSWDKIKGIPAGFADGIDNSGSGTGGTPDSISWENIKNIPADFADGVDNIGEFGSQPDSVRAASIADSCKKYPAQTLADGAVSGTKLAAGAVTNDKITWPAGSDGQVWKMGADGKPVWGADLQGAGGATTISGITGLADSLTSHRTLIDSKANAADLAGKANTSHTHIQGDITGLSTALTSLQNDIDDKADATALSGKADAASVYTKTEVTSLLSAKANTSDIPDLGDIYTKTQVDSKLSGKANTTDLAGLASTTDLAGKADASNVYSKTEVTSLLSSKANTTDLAGKANTTDVYTKTETQNLLASAGSTSGVEYSPMSSSQGYVSVTSANTSVKSITVSCPEAGYIIVYGNASVLYYSGATGTLMSVSAKVTLDQTTISGEQSQVNIPVSPSNMMNISFIGGYQVTQGNHTLRLLITPSEGDIRAYAPAITCVFSQNRL